MAQGRGAFFVHSGCQEIPPSLLLLKLSRLPYFNTNRYIAMMYTEPGMQYITRSAFFLILSPSIYKTSEKRVFSKDGWRSAPTIIYRPFGGWRWLRVCITITLWIKLSWRPRDAPEPCRLDGESWRASGATRDEVWEGEAFTRRRTLAQECCHCFREETES